MNRTTKLALTKAVFISLMAVGFSFVMSKNIGPVPGLVRPNMIEIAGDELYIVEGAVISIYSLKNLELIRKFGGEGEGPGELKVVPYHNNRVSVFPDFIPPIQTIEIADGKIYVQTFQKREAKVEYIVMDLTGKTLMKTYMPRLHTPSLKDQLIGVKKTVIQNGKLYFLKENEEQEIWELHEYEIKWRVTHPFSQPSISRAI